MRPISPSSTWSEKPATPREPSKAAENRTPERIRGSSGNSSRASSTENRHAITVMRRSPPLMARRAAPGSPASRASARSVWTISVQTVATAKSTRSGGKKTLSVRFAARITWKSERATSRNSERRGRASRSCKAWVRMAKWARATTASSPRAKSHALRIMMAPIDPFRTRPLCCQLRGASRSSAAAPIPTAARTTAQGAS